MKQTILFIIAFGDVALPDTNGNFCDVKQANSTDECQVVGAVGAGRIVGRGESLAETRRPCIIGETWYAPRSGATI